MALQLDEKQQQTMKPTLSRYWLLFGRVAKSLIGPMHCSMKMSLPFPRVSKLSTGCVSPASDHTQHGLCWVRVMIAAAVTSLHYTLALLLDCVACSSTCIRAAGLTNARCKCTCDEPGHVCIHTF